MTAKPLPRDFADLGGFADEWSLASERDRHRKRNAADLETVRVFYRALFPRMPAIMDYLHQFPVEGFDKLSAEVRNLHNLALAFMEISHPVDMLWRATDIDDAFPTERFEFQPPSSVR